MAIIFSVFQAYLISPNLPFTHPGTTVGSTHAYRQNIGWDIVCSLLTRIFCLEHNRIASHYIISTFCTNKGDTSLYVIGKFRLDSIENTQDKQCWNKPFYKGNIPPSSSRPLVSDISVEDNVKYRLKKTFHLHLHLGIILTTQHSSFTKVWTA